MKNYNKTLSTLLTLVLIFSVSSCQQSTKKTTSLYQQLGGKAVINALTEKLVDRLFNNVEIGFLFNDSDSDREDLIKHISAQICLETGGGCLYEGRDMQETHSGLDIRMSEFDIFVQEFIAAMEDVNIPFRHQNQVLTLFAVMRNEVTHQ